MTVGELASIIVESKGLWHLHYRHDDWCKTLRTQRTLDCTCNPGVRLISDDGALCFEIEGAL